MRFGHAGTRWAYARNAQHCSWSAAFNAGQRQSRRTFAGAAAAGAFKIGGPNVNMFDACEYVPFTARMPKGFAVSWNIDALLNTKTKSLYVAISSKHLSSYSSKRFRLFLYCLYTLILHNI